eukprot:scaffold225050_cov16-Tisochrysis_lutea.AAC.2
MMLVIMLIGSTHCCKAWMGREDRCNAGSIHFAAMHERGEERDAVQVSPLYRGIVFERCSALSKARKARSEYVLVLGALEDRIHFAGKQ